MKKELAQKLLDKVKKDYCVGSEAFSRRSKLWPGTIELIESNVKKGERVLDVGCGDGRWFEVLKDKGVEYVGIDNCEALIGIAQEKIRNPKSEIRNKSKIQNPNIKFLVGDILTLPFNDSQFDVVLCIAVLHHIPTQELQLKALDEMYRVLKPGGRLVMTNWNLLSEAYNINHVTTFLFNRIFKKSGLGFKDLFIPWGITGSKIKRYYYAFSLSELARLVKKAGFEINNKYYSCRGKKSSFWKQGNMILLVKK